MKIKNPAELLLLFVLIIAIAIVSSCEKESDLFGNTVIKQTTKLKTLKTFNGDNGGLTTKAKDRLRFLTAKDDDGLFLSQNPLIEYKYDIAIDYEEIFTYEIDSISNDTLYSSSVLNEISRDTISVTPGPIWLPLDLSNEVTLQVGLNEEFISSNLTFSIEARVTDNIPADDGLLFMVLKKSDADILALSPPPTIDSLSYQIVNNVPRYDTIGRITSLNHGVIIPRFAVRQYYINDPVIVRNFELIITSSSGGQVTVPFTIKFVEQQIWEERQCWLSGDPKCVDLWEN